MIKLFFSYFIDSKYIIVIPKIILEFRKWKTKFLFKLTLTKGVSYARMAKGLGLTKGKEYLPTFK